VVANVVGRSAFGAHPFLSLPPFEVASIWEYPLYAGLGLLAALTGVAFFRALYATEDAIDRLWRGPEWLRPGVGGIALGILLLALPEMYGVGYPTLEAAIRGSYAAWFLVLLLGGKILATSLTIGIGGSGGVFAPSLFMGAVLGTAYGQVVHRLIPGLTGSAGAYGLVGMGAVFAAAARAPITSALVIFELTGEYRIILPLLFAIALSTSISNLITRDTIYTLKLKRRGVDLGRDRTGNPMELITVGEAMEPIPEPLRSDQSLSDVVWRFAGRGSDALPVVDRGGHYLGAIVYRQVEEAVRDNALDVPVGTSAREIPTVTASQTLAQALAVLVPEDLPGIPVLDAGRLSVVGWLNHGAVLRAYQARLSTGVGTGEGRRGRGVSSS